MVCSNTIRAAAAKLFRHRRHRGPFARQKKNREEEKNKIKQYTAYDSYPPYSWGDFPTRTRLLQSTFANFSSALHPFKPSKKYVGKEGRACCSSLRSSPFEHFGRTHQGTKNEMKKVEKTVGKPRFPHNNIWWIGIPERVLLPS